MSDYGRHWEKLRRVRMKIGALVGTGFPQTLEEARTCVQQRKDELDQLLVDWEEIEKQMQEAPTR